MKDKTMIHEITYTKHGSIFYPDLALPEQPIKQSVMILTAQNTDTSKRKRDALLYIKRIYRLGLS